MGSRMKKKKKQFIESQKHEVTVFMQATQWMFFLEDVALKLNLH